MGNKVATGVKHDEMIPTKTITIKGKRAKAIGGGHIIGATVEIGVGFIGRKINVICYEKAGVFNFELPELPAERANSVMAMQALDRATDEMERLRNRVELLERLLGRARELAHEMGPTSFRTEMGRLIGWVDVATIMATDEGVQVPADVPVVALEAVGESHEGEDGAGNG